jgi:hypothetical protein
MRGTSRSTAARIREREAARSRVGKVTRLVAGGGILAVGLASAAAAASLPGRAPGPSPTGSSSTSGASGAGQSGAGQSGAGQSGAAATPPAPSSAPPVAVSGGS